MSISGDLHDRSLSTLLTHDLLHFILGLWVLFLNLGEFLALKYIFYGHMSNILMNAFVSFSNYITEMSLPHWNNYQAAF